MMFSMTSVPCKESSYCYKQKAVFLAFRYPGQSPCVSYFSLVSLCNELVVTSLRVIARAPGAHWCEVDKA